MALAVFEGDTVVEVNVENLFMVSKLLLHNTVDVKYILKKKLNMFSFSPPRRNFGSDGPSPPPAPAD